MAEKDSVGPSKPVSSSELNWLGLPNNLCDSKQTWDDWMYAPIIKPDLTSYWLEVKEQLESDMAEERFAKKLQETKKDK